MLEALLLVARLDTESVVSEACNRLCLAENPVNAEAATD